jgi:hypothetical protein
LLSYLTPEQQNKLGMSGSKLAESYGFGGDDYGTYFTEFNKQGLLDSLADLPELQRYGYNNARQNWMGNRNSLMNQMGRTGLASTGSFKNQWGEMNRNMNNNMFQTDRNTQNIAEGLSASVTDTLKNWENTALNLENLDAQKAGMDNGNTSFGFRKIGNWYDEHIGDWLKSIF